MQALELVIGHSRAQQNEVVLTEAVLTVAKLMGNSAEELVRYGFKPLDSEEADAQNPLMVAAKMIGNTVGDLQRYRGDVTVPHESGSMQDSDSETILEVAKFFGNTAEDIARFGL